MTKTSVLCLLVVALMVVAVGVNSQRRLGLNINLRKLLKDMKTPSKVELEVGCVTKQGPCTERGVRLRQFLPLVGSGGRCIRCTPAETRALRQVVVVLQRRYPRCWAAVVAAYEKRSGPKPRASGCA
ncbi:hypothetical protein Pmani_028205 [Petrolisthes manimaculis]|uniref:Uncharacterized protein n=1 Tax=Petrolisthes manimaculis TaxID=1843537 RepID=A0AAE1TV22_9EUCA|nr:hypothetical protein Pmani_028205 [Petrolisthes manimaculis]